MSKRTLLFLILGAISIQLQAQNSTVSLSWGPGFYARQDQTFSPFVHTDWSFLNFSAKYTRSAKWEQFVGIGFGNYNPSITPAYTYDSDEQTYPHTFTLVNLDYGLGKQLNNGTDQHKFSAGGLFEADVEPSTYEYGWASSFGYFASFSLGGWFTYKYIPDEKNSFSAKVAMPLVSLVARSPYLVNDDEFIENTYSHNGFKTFMAYLADGEIQTLNNIQQVELLLDYKRQLSEKWQIGGSYEFRFIHASSPTNFLSYRDTFFVCGTFLF